jgi:hypothetical protein
MLKAQEWEMVQSWRKASQFLESLYTSATGQAAALPLSLAFTHSSTVSVYNWQFSLHKLFLRLTNVFVRRFAAISVLAIASGWGTL